MLFLLQCVSVSVPVVIAVLVDYHWPIEDNFDCRIVAKTIVI